MVISLFLINRTIIRQMGAIALVACALGVATLRDIFFDCLSGPLIGFLFVGILVP